MIKLSITLPNSAQLSIEADDPDMIREVLGFTLPQLGTVANDLTAVNGAINGHPPLPNGIGDGDDTVSIPESKVDGIGASPETLQAAVEPAAVSHRATGFDQHAAAARSRSSAAAAGDGCSTAGNVGSSYWLSKSSNRRNHGSLPF